MEQGSKLILLPVELIEQIFKMLAVDWYEDQYGKKRSWIYCPHPKRGAGRNLMNFRLVHPQLAWKSQRIFYKTIFEWIDYSARRFTTVQALSQHSQACQYVKRLGFGPEHRGGVGPTQIATTIAQFGELEWLSVRRMPISLSELNNPKLRELRLNMEHYEGFHSLVVNDVIQFLKSHPTLEYVMIYDYCLESGSAILILEATRNIPTLKRLKMVFLKQRSYPCPSTIWHSSPNDTTDLQELYGNGNGAANYRAEDSEWTMAVGPYYCSVGDFGADPAEPPKLIDVVIKKYYELVEAHEKRERERLERERLEAERLENERLENERLEKERLEKEQLEKEQSEKERLEKGRLAKTRWKGKLAKFAKERLKKDNGQRRSRPPWRVPGAH